jgi:hypothetical protein
MSMNIKKKITGKSKKIGSRDIPFPLFKEFVFGSL